MRISFFPFLPFVYQLWLREKEEAGWREEMGEEKGNIHTSKRKRKGGKQFCFEILWSKSKLYSKELIHFWGQALIWGTVLSSLPLAMLPSPLWSLRVWVQVCLKVEGWLWVPLDRFWVLTVPLGLAFSGERPPLYTLGEEDLGQCISEWVVCQCNNSISEFPHLHWPPHWWGNIQNVSSLYFSMNHTSAYCDIPQQVQENTTAGK